MPHSHRLVVGGASLVRGRIRGQVAAGTKARDEVEACLPHDFFASVPFGRLSLMIRFGAKTRLDPWILGITGEYLDIAVEVPMKELSLLRDPAQLEQAFRQVILDAVLAVAAKYHLPDERLREMRQRTPTVFSVADS